jgi:hypothetical protein
MYLLYVLFFRSRRLWFLPFIFGVILLIITNNLINRSTQSIKTELHANVSPLAKHGAVMISEPIILLWILLAFALVGGILLLLYYRAIKGIWPFNRKGVIYKGFLLQGLINDLDSIAKDRWANNDYQSIRPAIGQIREWKDKAKTLLFHLFGQEELNNFKEKIKYVEEKDEYYNPSFGYIQAFSICFLVAAAAWRAARSIRCILSWRAMLDNKRPTAPYLLPSRKISPAMKLNGTSFKKSGIIHSCEAPIYPVETYLKEYRDSHFRRGWKGCGGSLAEGAK